MSFADVQIFSDEKTNVDVIKELLTKREDEAPFYIFDVGDLINKHKIWRSKLPRVKPHYAVKTNPHPDIVRTLAALGTGFDCASKHEMQQVLSYGVSPDRIIFAHTMKFSSDIRFARKVGIEKLTADSETELQKIKCFFPEAKVVVRIRCDARVSFGNLRGKFGCDTDNNEAKDLLKTAQNLGLNVHGFSFFVGTQCEEPGAFSRGVKKVLKIMEYAKSIGIPDVKLMDIGGGFPGPLDQMDEVFESIINALQEVDLSIALMSEPGRYYVDSAFTLVCSIYGKKIVHRENETRYMYYINDGIHGSFRVLTNRRSPIPLTTPLTNEKHLSIFWGSTCNNDDCIAYDCEFPEMRAGDWVTWQNMGAYTLSMASSFNGIHPPVVIPFVRKTIWSSFVNHDV